jgi:GTP cyclohydrolase I
MSNIVASELERVTADQPTAEDDEFERLVRRQLELLGEDPDREGLRRTPLRVARALTWLTQGYETDVRDVIGAALFEDPHDNMIMVRDIELYSLCEHHLLPFVGRAHVAYVPEERVVGLSEIVHLVEGFSRRPQLQERLTAQIADALYETLGSRGSVVVVEAEQLCMTMRGAQKPGTVTVTSAIRGVLDEDPGRRAEIMALISRSERRG